MTFKLHQMALSFVASSCWENNGVFGCFSYTNGFREKGNLEKRYLWKCTNINIKRVFINVFYNAVDPQKKLTRCLSCLIKCFLQSIIETLGGGGGPESKEPNIVPGRIGLSLQDSFSTLPWGFVSWRVLVHKHLRAIFIQNGRDRCYKLLFIIPYKITCLFYCINVSKPNLTN